MREKIHKALLLVLRRLRLSVAVITAVSVVAGIYTLIAEEIFTLRHIFMANITVGAFLTTIGVVLFFLPVWVRKDKLLDHSTYVERTFDARETKRIKAYDAIYVGLGVAVIAAAVEQIVWLLA